MRKQTLLARLFGRSQHPVVTALFTHAFGQPLLVHPAMGEHLIAAYLEGAVDAPPSVAETADNVAIINVSGALIHRPMPGLCDPGPMSYTAVREAYDAALADDSVGAIVMRLQSPGGVASGVFDLTDHIFANRGKKPVYAVIDDYAYSGAYAIAAACDEIIVSRTGGVGSVGVVGYHYDQSAYNEKLGVKVTAVYAGDAKIDGSPHFPLEGAALARWQAEVNRLYDLFAGAVAQYRGMEVTAVRATQARTYHGPEAIAAGLATRMGTLESLLAELQAQRVAVAAVEGEAAQQTRADKERQQVRLAVKGALTAAVHEAKVPPDLIAALTKAEIESADEIPVRIEHARQVADLCAAAHLRDCAANYIERNVALETVRAELLSAVEDDPKTQVSTILPSAAGAVKKDNKLSPQTIYRQRRDAASALSAPQSSSTTR